MDNSQSKYSLSNSGTYQLLFGLNQSSTLIWYILWGCGSMIYVWHLAFLNEKNKTLLNFFTVYLFVRTFSYKSRIITVIRQISYKERCAHWWNGRTYQFYFSLKQKLNHDSTTKMSDSLPISRYYRELRCNQSFSSCWSRYT